MKNLALSRIQAMKPYSPPLAGRRDFSGDLLDFNERTVPPSAKVQTAIQNLLKSNKLNLYPEYGNLEKKLTQCVEVKDNQVMITNGSDQAIDLVFRTFTDVGDTVIIPSPSFTMFSQCAQIVGNKILTPLYKKEDLSFPLDELMQMIDQSVKLIVICNPNNPTGTLLSVENIRKIAEKAVNAIVLVDEAYFDYSNVTVVPLIEEYPNIIVLRTLSKAFGLPALRIGYVVAADVYISELLKVRGPYDVNMIAYTAALAAFNDLKSIKTYSSQIMKQSKPLVENFFRKSGITFYPSAANFLLYQPMIEKEADILKENGILVLPQDKTNITGTLRLTIGTTQQMKNFIKVYENKILNRTEAKKYAFIDRDGTLIFEPQDTFQIDSLEKLKVLDGVITGLKLLKKLGYELVMVTNQDGLGTVTFPQADFEAPQNKMLAVFKENGITFRNIFVCPHLPSENCSCRKPKLGLVEEFLKKNNIDKTNSFVCGDRPTDKAFADNIGITFIPMQTNGNFYETLEKGGLNSYDKKKN